MPVTVRFDPTSTSKQAQIIPNASTRNDGVMTAAQVAQLNAVVAGGVLSLGSDRFPSASPGAVSGALEFKTDSLKNGLPGPGFITFANARVGDVILMAINLGANAPNYGTSSFSSFESVVTVDGQIQQINPADISDQSFLFVLIGAAR